jgi:Kdo2-lipid IVA lauroyltransferase/acyltransferase
MLLRLFSRLPLPLLYAFFGFVAWILRAGRWQGGLVADGLARCLPERDAAERRRIANEFYLWFGRLSAEIIHGARIAPERLEEHLRFEKDAVVREALAGGRRVLLLAAHQCNWEWLLLECSRRLGAPLVAPYKPIKIATADRWARDMRSRFGATLVPADDLVAHLIAQRGEVKLIAMLADQCPPVRAEQKCWRPFFGQDTAFFQGPGWIGAKLRFDPVFIAMRPDGHGRYVARFVPLSAAGERPGPDQILTAYVRELERQVHDHPAQYYWAYKRWKRARRLYD